LKLKSPTLNVCKSLLAVLVCTLSSCNSRILDTVDSGSINSIESSLVFEIPYDKLPNIDRNRPTNLVNEGAYQLIDSSNLRCINGNWSRYHYNDISGSSVPHLNDATRWFNILFNYCQDMPQYLVQNQSEQFNWNVIFFNTPRERISSPNGKQPAPLQGLANQIPKELLSNSIYSSSTCRVYLVKLNHPGNDANWSKMYLAYTDFPDRNRLGEQGFARRQLCSALPYLMALGFSPDDSLKMLSFINYNSENYPVFSDEILFRINGNLMKVARPTIGKE